MSCIQGARQPLSAQRLWQDLQVPDRNSHDASQSVPGCLGTPTRLAHQLGALSRQYISHLRGVNRCNVKSECLALSSSSSSTLMASCCHDNIYIQLIRYRADRRGWLVSTLWTTRSFNMYVLCCGLSIRVVF